MSAAAGQHVAKGVVITLQSLQNDSRISLFWKLVKIQSQPLDVGALSLP